MSLQTWQETLITSQVDSTAHGNTVTPTSILPGAAKFVLPQNFMQIGRVLRVTAYGRISNIVTAPGTLTLDVRFGSAVVFNSGAVALNTTAKTSVSWRMEAILTCRAIGSGANSNLIGMGSLLSESVSGSAAGLANEAMLPASVPAVGAGFDATATQTVDLFATWSVANAGNTITTHQYVLEALN